MKARAILSQFLGFLFPARCVLCGQLGVSSICLDCLSGFEPIALACRRCGRQRLTAFASPDCGECHGRRLGFTQARSSFVYNAAGRQILAEFKFNRRDSAGAWLSQQIKDFLTAGPSGLYGPDAPLPTLIVPVPIHRERRRERGFNQAEDLAESAAAALRLPHRPQVLERLRPTPTQVGLSPSQRQANVRGAFAVPKAQTRGVDGACVLLVDDLMTTGATLAACSAALRRGGAKAILGLTVFSTSRTGESAAPPSQSGSAIIAG